MLYLPVTLRTVCLIYCLALTTPATAQPLLERLADDVCDCMTQVPEIVYPRIQASRCVDKTAERYGASIRKNLQLDVEEAADRSRLSELLIDPLTAGCPLLQKLAKEDTEPELHYSDYDLLATGQRYRSEKHPPPDPASTTSRETTATQTVIGTIEGITDDELHLRTPAGTLLQIGYQPRQLRPTPPAPGQTVTLSYRREWDVEGTTVICHLVEIKLL